MDLDAHLSVENDSDGRCPFARCRCGIGPMGRAAAAGSFVLVSESQGMCPFLQVPEHIISGRKEAHLALHTETRARFDRVAELIDGFETPYGMELLSSVHWVARENEVARRSAAAALSEVHEWSSRKRALFQPRHIEIAWNRLHENAWFDHLKAPAL